MKPRFLLNSSLLLFLVASACTPTAAPTEAEATQAVIAPPVTVIEATATLGAPDVADPATQSVVVDVQPIATSRGPNLEATDPSTVNLASGQLQLVEFFRFT